ncbi:MAG: exopolysaccharide biosynthesis polyprenyl glycosylphosphotransferase [Frankiales bacterium]|nr:exopolysaccharide biosynthesis polyprenyl glycosylphosphotransferase [Frankiales bacterium]
MTAPSRSGAPAPALVAASLPEQRKGRRQNRGTLLTRSLRARALHTDPTTSGSVDERTDISTGMPPLTMPPGQHEPAVTRAVDIALPPLRSSAWQRQLVRRLITLDALAALVAAALAVLVRFGHDPSTLYQVTPLLFPFIWVASCASTRSYEHRFLGTGNEEFRRVFDAGVRLLAVAALASFAFKLDLARAFVLLAFPLTVGLSLASRYACRQLLHRRRAQGECLHRVVVVGRERSCAELVRQLRREPYAGFSVVGACIDRTQGPTVEDVPVVGTSRSVIEALRATGADTVAVGAWSDLTQADLRRLSWELEGSGVDLVVAPSLTDVAGPRIHIRPVAGLPLLHVEQPEFSGGRRLLKSTFDRAAALAVLLLTSPLLITLALAVRLTSTGPALFRQTRVGVSGRDFTMYKFRSMHVDAEARLAELQEHNEASDGLLFKMRDDPRVTGAGRWLRRYSLDELPQLLNVVRGDMSLVGPRPPLPREVAQYGDDVRRRLLVRPGLTGLWQISGRSDLSWDESVRLDLHYVENWSLALDVMIIWRTVFTVLKRNGAY